MEIGDLVRHKVSMKEMTVMRLTGDEESAAFESIDRRMQTKGFNIGDPTCMWFEGSILNYSIYKASELDVLVYKGAAGAAAADIEQTTMMMI